MALLEGPVNNGWKLRRLKLYQRSKEPRKIGLIALGLKGLWWLPLNSNLVPLQSSIFCLMRNFELLLYQKIYPKFQMTEKKKYIYKLQGKKLAFKITIEWINHQNIALNDIMIMEKHKIFGAVLYHDFWCLISFVALFESLNRFRLT